MSDLPRILAEIALVAGEDAALAIARVRGGTQVYIPPVPGVDHWMSQAIGHERAKAVCDRLTCGTGVGMRTDLPIGPAGTVARTQARVDALLREGRSERDIVAATGYTARGIRMRRAKLDDRQLPLI